MPKSLDFGLFWLSLIGIFLLPKMGLAEASDPSVIGIYLGLWGIFSLFMFFGTLHSNLVLRILFAGVVVLFWLLAVGNFTDNQPMLRFAGYEGIVCGFMAIYLAMAEVLNEQFQRTILPTGEPAADNR